MRLMHSQHRVIGSLFLASALFTSTGCGLKTDISDKGGAAGRTQACPVRNVSGTVLVQSFLKVREPDGSWDSSQGKIQLTMLFSTMRPSDGSLKIVQQMSMGCASNMRLAQGNTVNVIASIPQGGSNCQAAAIALNDPMCAD